MALVIGNDAYEQVTPLRKAVYDARAIGQTLTDIGFAVLRAENVTRRGMNEQIQAFAAELEKGDEALFFFAGHGVEIDGRNFLLPIDIPKGAPGQEGFITTEAIPVDDILYRMRERGTRVSILILDACRDNPFPRTGTRSLGGGRGLARMPAPEGTFIMYSAGVGQAALDGLGENDQHTNSVFTRSLVPLLKEPGLSLTATARQVRRDVQKLARSISHEQRPAYYDEVTGQFFFTPGEGADEASTPAAPSQDDTLWQGIEASKNEADFQFYLRQFPRGKFAALAKLKLEQLEAGTQAPPGDAAGQSLPTRDASDLRGNWACVGKMTTDCASMSCTAKVSVREKLAGGRYAGRSRISCRVEPVQGCRLPKEVKRNIEAQGSVAGEVDGASVRVTFLAEKPNEAYSSISEYQLDGETLTYVRDLQGETTNYSELCQWSPMGPDAPVAESGR